MLRSLVRPDRISSPITRIAAVTVAGPLIFETPSCWPASLTPYGPRAGRKLAARLVLGAGRSICVAVTAGSGKGLAGTAGATFVSAAEHVSRRSGQIRLHGPEDF